MSLNTSSLETDRLIGESQYEEIDVDNRRLRDSHFVTLSSAGYNSYYINIIKSCFNVIAHMLVASSLTVTMWFVFKRGQFTSYEQHIVFSVLGVS